MKRLGMTLAAVLALGGLTGCGNDPESRESPFSMAVDTTRSKVKGRQSAAAAPLTRAAVEQVPGPLILATLESRGVRGAIFPAAQNGRTTTWATADQRSVIMDGPVVRGTRGLGEDMMSAAIPSVVELSRGGHVTHREYYFVDGNDQTVRQKYSCDIMAQGSESIEIVERRYNTARYAEVCRGQNGTFTNEYWFAGGTKIVQSRQWISPSVGFLKLQTLKP